MSVKNLDKISEMLETGVILHMQNGIEQCDTHEVGEIIDMIKDLAEAKYKCTVTKAMEEYDADDMDDEDAEPKKWYRRMRDSKGRYMSRHYTEPEYHMTPEMYHAHTAEEYRDMDRQKGLMHYTEPNMMNGGTNSRYDSAKKNYTESKMANPNDSQGNLKAIETLSNIIKDDVKELLPMMNATEKTMLKQKMTNVINEIV